MPFFVKLCSDRAAYEVKLRRKARFAMHLMKQLFEATNSYKILVDTPHIIIVKSCDGVEVTFSKNGRMLIKNVANKSEAEVIAKNVLQIALKALNKKLIHSMFV